MIRKRHEAEGYAPHNTVLCMCDDQDLQGALRVQGSALGYQVYEGTRDSPDAIAIPCFAMVLDRGFMGLDEYEAFTDYLSEVGGASASPDADSGAEGETAWCIIIDGRSDLAMPRLPVVLYADPAFDGKYRLVLDMVRLAQECVRSRTDRRSPC